MAKVRFESTDISEVYHSGDDDDDDNDHDHHYVSIKKSPPPPPPTPATPVVVNHQKFRAEVLRGNMMRTHLNRDPLFYYEIISVLGVGSMGSVAKVKKKDEAIGGSARKNIQKHFRREKRFHVCWNLPLVGGWFQHCLDGGNNNNSLSESSSADSPNNSSSQNSSLIHAKTNLVEDYNDGHGESDENLYAMKSIHLSRVTDPTFLEELRNEITILKTLDHYHIAKAMETFEYRNQIFVVLELCSGGDLYSRDPYTEEEAARIVCSMLGAISYMHSMGVAHRDLKYENILFVDNSPQAEIKLIDFGLSKKFATNVDMTDGVGTIYTMAPEVLKGSYTMQADLWSTGVIAFMLLSSQMPFYGRKRRHIVEQIMAGRFEFKGRRWKRISDPAKALVEDLLVVDPHDRSTASEAASANWLNRRLSATTRNPYAEEVKHTKKTMLRYAKYARLKKLALMVVAHKSSSKEIGILRKIFQKHDTTKDGQLSYEEFRAAIYDAGYSEDNYRELFDAVDLDGTGAIRYTEFLAATIEAQGAISEQRLAEAFDRIDSDDSGYITARNLTDMLGDGFPHEEVHAIIKEADLTKDNRISYAEFLALFSNDDELKSIRQMVPTESERSAVSEISSETADTVETNDVARSSFVEEKKRQSERKFIPESIQAKKHVLFNGKVEAIPGVEYEDEDGEDGVLSAPAYPSMGPRKASV